MSHGDVEHGEACSYRRGAKELGNDGLHCYIATSLMEQSYGAYGMASSKEASRGMMVTSLFAA